MVAHPQFGLCAIAPLPVVGNVANANPCMGSFVGRKRDGNTHKQVWSRFGKPSG